MCVIFDSVMTGNHKAGTQMHKRQNRVPKLQGLGKIAQSNNNQKQADKSKRAKAGSKNCQEVTQETYHQERLEHLLQRMKMNWYRVQGAHRLNTVRQS